MPRLLALLRSVAVSISKRQLVRLSNENHEAFIVEARDVLRAGLETSPWVTADDTGARHAGENGFCTQIGNERFTPIGQLYRDRADCENGFDELKYQCLSREADQRGGFTTQDLTRCRLLAGTVALIYNCWSLFVRLADPDHHREAITTRPLLPSAVARQTQHTPGR